MPLQLTPWLPPPLQLGHGIARPEAKPRPVSELTGLEIAIIAAGGDHTAAISRHGLLYTWGRGCSGQLGLGDFRDGLAPRRVIHGDLFGAPRVAPEELLDEGPAQPRPGTLLAEDVDDEPVGHPWAPNFRAHAKAKEAAGVPPAVVGRGRWSKARGVVVVAGLRAGKSGAAGAAGATGAAPLAGRTLVTKDGRMRTVKRLNIDESRLLPELPRGNDTEVPKLRGGLSSAATLNLAPLTVDVDEPPGFLDQVRPGVDAVAGPPPDPYELLEEEAARRRAEAEAAARKRELRERILLGLEGGPFSAEAREAMKASVMAEAADSGLGSGAAAAEGRLARLPKDLHKPREGGGLLARRAAESPRKEMGKGGSPPPLPKPRSKPPSPTRAATRAFTPAADAAPAAKKDQLVLPAAAVGAPVTAVACGSEHTLVLSAVGAVYAFGSNDHSQLGLGEAALQRLATPTLVRPLLSERLVAIAAGGCTSLATNWLGRVYGWGEGSNAQFGAGHVDDLPLPTFLDEAGPGAPQAPPSASSLSAPTNVAPLHPLAGVKFGVVAVGGAHVILAEQSGRRAWTLGAGAAGRPSDYHPTRIAALLNAPLSARESHSLLITTGTLRQMLPNEERFTDLLSQMILYGPFSEGVLCHILTLIFKRVQVSARPGGVRSARAA